MTAFHEYYHSESENCKDFEDCTKLPTLMACSYAYESAALDLNHIFGDKGILFQMVASRSYTSKDVRKLFENLRSEKLRVAFIDFANKTGRAEALEVLKAELEKFLIYSENYAKENEFKIENDEENTIDEKTNGKFIRRINKDRPTVLHYKKGHAEQLLVVDYLVDVVPVFEDIKNLFGPNSLIDSLIIALEEISPFAQKLNQIKQTKRLETARIEIGQKLSKINTPDLRNILLTMCQSIRDTDDMSNENDNKSMIKNLKLMANQIKDWHRKTITKLEEMLLEKGARLSTMQYLSMSLNLCEEWCRDAFIPITVTRGDIDKVKPQLEKLEKAAANLNRSMFSKLFSSDKDDTNNLENVSQKSRSSSSSTSTSHSEIKKSNSEHDNITSALEAGNSRHDSEKNEIPATPPKKPEKPQKPAQQSEDKTKPEKPQKPAKPVKNAIPNDEPKPTPPPKPPKPTQTTNTENNTVINENTQNDNNLLQAPNYLRKAEQEESKGFFESFSNNNLQNDQQQIPEEAEQTNDTTQNNQINENNEDQDMNENSEFQKDNDDEEVVVRRNSLTK